MLNLSIPGGQDLQLSTLMLDYNGTLAEDGVLIHGVAERLVALSEWLTIQVVTADTHGSAHHALAGLPIELSVLPSTAPQDGAKAALVNAAGAAAVVAIGNGRNDVLMLQTAALGIAVIQAEGGAVVSLLAATVVCRSITEALDLLLHPKRLVATLRNL